MMRIIPWAEQHPVGRRSSALRSDIEDPVHLHQLSKTGADVRPDFWWSILSSWNSTDLISCAGWERGIVMTRLFRAILKWFSYEPEPLNDRARGWLDGELASKREDWPRY